MKKRILSVLLTVVMLIGLLPTAVFAADGTVAIIGTTAYDTLQEAINAVQNNETIVLQADYAEDVTITQTANKSFTIDGDGNTYSGTITINGNNRYTGAETLTIKNVKFESATSKYFITTGSVKNSHNVTVDDCSFTYTGEGRSSLPAMYFRTPNKITVKNSTGTNLYSFLYTNAGANITVDGVTLTNCGTGLNLSSTGNLIVKNSDIAVVGDCAVIFGANGTSGQGLKLTLENNTLSTTSTTYPVVFLRGNAADATVSVTDSVLLGDYQIQYQGTPANEVSVTIDGDVVAHENNVWSVVSEAGKFTIAYRDMFGEHVGGTTKVTYIAGETITLKPTTLKHSGYTFDHWNSKSDGTGKYKFADGAILSAEEVAILFRLAQDKTDNTVYLNARWTPNKDTPYKVQHLLLAANGVDNYKAHATYTYKGETDTLTQAKALTNIEGYTAKDFEQLNIKGNGSTMVKIYYTRNDYTLTYNLDGGIFEDGTDIEQTVQYLKKLTAPTEPYRTGYTFAGWDNIPERMPAGDLTVTALWNANEYTVRFDANGGEGIMEDMSMVYDQEQTLPANAFTNKGYTFSGWKLGEAEYADGADVSNLTAEDNAIVTLSAIWTPNTYTVCFNGNGGSGNMDDISRTFKDKQPLPECGFVREGYTFIGWNTKADAEIAQYVPGDKYNLVSTNGKVVTLYAIWRANGYIVTFDVNGGDELTPDSMPVVYNSVYGTLPTPTRSGYIFKAWTINNTVINADTIVSIVGDHTLVAEWTDNEFTVTFETNGGSAVDMQNIPGGGTVTEPTDPKKKNYVFAGWYADEECTVIFDFSTPIYSDTILYAKWEEATDLDLNIWYMMLLKIRNQKFEITADATDGGIITPEGISEVKYDNDITYTITPHEGYIIADVIVDGESIGVVSEYTFKDVREAHSISVAFEKAE